MSQKLQESIQEIFVFFTPSTIDQCFEFLQKRIRKIHKVATLQIQGDELPNLHSESHIFNQNLINVFPTINLVLKQSDVKTEKEVESELELDLNMEQKLKQFTKNQKKNKIHKSCIIDKKVS